MKVLQVAMRLDPAIGGSTTSTVSNIVAEQRQGIHNTVVFAYGADDDARTQPVVARLQREGVRVKRFARLSRPAAASAQFGLSPTAGRWLARHGSSFDVVHAHGPWGAITAGALVVARRHGVPTVLTARESLTTHDRDTSQSGLRARAKTIAWRGIPRLADIVVYTSELERSGSPSAGRLGSRVIWHAVVDDVAAPPPLQVRPAESDDVVIGFLGRFDPKKNLPLLIDAVARERRLRLIVGGGGNPGLERALKARVTKLGIDDRVVFLGFVTAVERPAFFASIDVLGLPSAYENFGMAAAEAMEHGVPVLVSDRTGLAELLLTEGGGSTVSLDPGALADAALTWGCRGRDPGFALRVQNTARRHLSYTAHATAALALYREIARPSE